MPSMSITQVFNFDNESNFTLSNTQIESSAAKLALIDNPNQNFSQDFSSDTGFTYNTSLAEFTGGQVQQKDQTPAGSIFATDFTTKDLLWNKEGSTVGTLSGTASIVSGALSCSGDSGVTYAYATNAVESFKFIYIPGYTTAPASNVDIISTAPSTGQNDRFTLNHSPSGNTLRLSLYNDSGSIIFATGTSFSSGGLFEPTAGQSYEFLVVIDSATGFVRVYIDGVLNASRTLAAWSRGGTTSTLNVGTGPAYQNADASFDDLIIFDNVQETSNYTPGYSLVTNRFAGSTVALPPFSYTGIGTVQEVTASVISESGSPRYIVGGLYWDGTAWVPSDGSYAQAVDSATVVANLDQITVTGAVNIPVSVVFTDSNTQGAVDDIDITVTGQRYSPTGYIEPAQAIEAQSLLSYAETSTVNANTEINIILKVDGQLKYYDGAAWVDSDGTKAQSNTASEVNTNASSLSLGANSSIFIRWLLETSTNTDTPEISTASISYDFGAVQSSVQICNVHGYLKDIADNPISGATVTFQLNKPALDTYSEASERIISTRSISTTTNSNGYFQQDLIRSSEYEQTTTYKVTIDLGGNVVLGETTTLSFSVPDSTTKDITDLLPPVSA